jgi:hypothetical protein
VTTPDNTSPVITTASTTPSTLPLTTVNTGVYSAVSESANGLRLYLSLDGTAYKAGQQVLITLDEQNTLTTVNNIPAAHNWPVKGLAIGHCGTINYPFGFAIFKGYFSADDASTATPLNLYNPNEAYHCPMILSEITAYNFKPSGDIADILGSCTPDKCISDMVTKTGVPITGYWTTGSLINSSNFDPGIYTVVGGDEWGNIVILHFTVTK